jgi:hypothetical protein
MEVHFWPSATSMTKHQHPSKTTSQEQHRRALSSSLAHGKSLFNSPESTVHFASHHFSTSHLPVEIIIRHALTPFWKILVRANPLMTALIHLGEAYFDQVSFLLSSCRLQSLLEAEAIDASSLTIFASFGVL